MKSFYKRAKEKKELLSLTTSGVTFLTGCCSGKSCLSTEIDFMIFAVVFWLVLAYWCFVVEKGKY